MEVAYPADQSQAVGLFLGIGPEEHTLHPTLNNDMDTFLCHPTTPCLLAPIRG